MSGIIAVLLNWLGGGVLDKVLGHLEARVNNETERQRIRSMRDQHMATMQAHVITSGMEHKWFWVPWLIATVPLSMWFGWGMLDTLLNGRLPDVAEIPRGLLPWAEAAWSNLFFSAAGLAGLTSIAKAIRR